MYQDAAKAHKLKMIFGADIQEPTLQSRLIHTQGTVRSGSVFITDLILCLLVIELKS